MSNEVWLPIIGNEKCYEISNLGRVRSVVSGRILKPVENKKGYLFVHLKYGGSGKSYIHRLVAEAFLKNDKPEERKEVNHIDFNPKNNVVSNLEWVSHKENMHHSIKNGRFERTEQWLSSLRLHCERNGRSVIGTNIVDGTQIKFVCLNDCKKQGFSPSCVCNCCKGKRQAHKGYTWRYSNERQNRHSARR